MKTLIMKVIGQYLNVLAIIAPQRAGRLSLAIFCKPFRIKISSKQSAFFATAKRFTVTHNNETIAAYSWGNGEKKVLMLHGWQSHTYRWKPYVEQLIQQGFSVYAFDAPGHGLSTGNFLSVPLYSEVIEKVMLHIGKIDAIVSHSIGGFSTLYTLHRNPFLRTDKVIVMAAPGEASEFFDFYKKSLSLTQRSIDLTAQRFEELFHHTPQFFSSSKFASTLTSQGLIIHDELDDETSVEHATRVHQHWASSKLLITKGLGHNLKSKEIIHEVVTFLTEEIPVSEQIRDQRDKVQIL